MEGHEEQRASSAKFAGMHSFCTGTVLWRRAHLFRIMRISSACLVIFAFSADQLLIAFPITEKLNKHVIVVHVAG
jgi:hypothetical protein